MKWLLGIFGLGAIGVGTYFTLRSKDNRVNDINKVSETVKKGYESAASYGSNLVHTEKTTPASAAE